MTDVGGDWWRWVLVGGRGVLRDAGRTSWTLFKIIVPLSVLTRLADEAGLIEPLGRLLGPVMELVGLPGSMGIVWATGLVTNLYGAMVVFASLSGEAGLSVAQVTVLTTMILVAHALPVELRIAQQAGPRARAMVGLRVGGALVLGWLLDRIYSLGSWLQEANVAIWNPGVPPADWGEWAVSELWKLGSIFAIILCMLGVMRVLAAVGVMGWLTRGLEPVLRGLGMSGQAAPITIIGVMLGISYGGGLIIQEARSGRLSERDVFFSLSLMGLCHSLVEDSLLMMVIGGHQSGVLWGRLVFSLVVVFVLVRVVGRMGDAAFGRHLFRR